MELKKCESGYTFASLLLSLVIIMIIMPLIILLLQIINFNPTNSHIDAHQFFSFLHSDVLVASDIEIDQKENIIYYWVTEGENGVELKTSFEKYGSTIRSRVQGQGHVIYLRNIDDFLVTPVAYGFHIKLVMENGEEYEKTIAHQAMLE